MDTEVNITVAAIQRSVSVDDCSIAEVIPVRSVVDEVIAIHKCLVATNHNVSVGVEGIFDMQMYLDSAIAAMYGLIHQQQNSIVEVVTIWQVANIVVVAWVGESLVTTDGVVTNHTEGIVDMQVEHNNAVAGVECREHNFVTTWVEIMEVGVVINFTGTDCVEDFSMEGVAFEHTQYCDTVAAESAVAHVSVISSVGVDAVFIDTCLASADSVVYGIAVGRFNNDLHISTTFYDDTCVAVSFVTSLGSSVESSIGHCGITSNCLCISKIVVAVEQTS